MATQKIVQQTGSDKGGRAIQSVKAVGNSGLGGSRSHESMKPGVAYDSNGKEKGQYKLRPDQTPIHPQGKGMTATHGQRVADDVGFKSKVRG